ncbi:MAG: RNA polymerase sigma factor, partial [Planctomycetia bacterium]|nr:RNA polymerase sigma factor [Planctomycetia bacterium]
MSASPPSQTPSATRDAELLAGFVVRHDQDAFAELVRKHGPLVYRACRRVLGGVQDAEDVFQATFVVLARKAATIAPPEMVGSWLYGVACRLALKARAQGQRRQARERVGAGAILVQCPHGSAGVEGNANEVRPILDEELLRLSETYRLPLVLCYLEGKSHTEVAQQLGCQEPALRQRLLRGREQLRERLARRGLGASLAVLATVLTQEGAKAAHPAHGAPSFAVFPSTSSEGLTPQVAALADSLAPSSATVFRPRLLVIGVLFSLAILSAWWSMRPAAPIHVVWRFSKGPASDLRVARGQWQHRAD